jgi:hypothetical protein
MGATLSHESHHYSSLKNLPKGLYNDVEEHHLSVLTRTRIDGRGNRLPSLYHSPALFAKP